MVINNQLSTGTLIATILLAGRLIQLIQKTLLLCNQFQYYRLSVQPAKDIFSIPQINRQKQHINAEKIGLLELRNVRFGYKEREVFNNLNLTIKAP